MEIDSLVGPRGRSAFLVETARNRRGRRELLAELARREHGLATTSLNVAEVFAGMRKEEKTQTEAFLGALDCYTLTRTAGQLAGTLKSQWARKGRTLTIADAIVAAIAVEHDCILMTDNRKDLPMPELEYYPLRKD
jgi:predicted nucleic acid-binding protein